MKLLLVAATELELQPLLGEAKYVPGSVFQLLQKGDSTVDVLITGVGIASATFHITRLLSSRRYDLAIQAGIGGSFNKQINLGDVVIVSNDRFAQLGADDDATFLDVFELGFCQPNNYPFVNGSLEPSIPAIAFNSNLKLVHAITVETASGNEQSITKTLNKYHPDIESMEGAAFYFCCMHMHLPCFQLRSISNYVEKRNKANWNIPLAVEQLNIALQKIISNSIL